MDDQYLEGKKIPTIGCNGYVHVVEKEDTLYSIAKKYDVRLFELLRLNPYVNVYNLQIGDEICIPSLSIVHEEEYVVKVGDTMKEILEHFGLPFETIASYNPQLYEIPLQEGFVFHIPECMPRAIES